jgi:hypothetical protein
VREIGIGLLGVGVVGGGVLKIYEQHRADLEARAGCGLRTPPPWRADVTRAPRGSREPPGPLSADPAGPPWTRRVSSSSDRRPGAGAHPVLRALDAGKHVS